MRLTIVAVVVVAATTDAAAYPQFQLSTGADRCQACHFSPGGGALINDYGRSEAGDTISRGGDGGLLHGAWQPPDWLALGGDLRYVGAIKYRDDDRELLGFPMQADLYTRVAFGDVSFNMIAGVRGGARDPQPPLVERVASREHYAMYQRGDGLYVRAGRFFPIFGVRSQDHTAFVRRYLGFHTLEEPYGIAAGTFGARWEAHVSAFVPRPVDVLGAGAKATGAAAYYERRFADDTLAVAGQTRVAITDADTRVAVGAIAKRWFADAGVLVLGEIDLQRQAFADAFGATRYQLAGYLGASKTIVAGVMVGVALHRWQPDLTLRSSRDAFEIDVHCFPLAHVELHLLTRLTAEGNDLDDPGALALLQLHYYP